MASDDVISITRQTNSVVIITATRSGRMRETKRRRHFKKNNFGVYLAFVNLISGAQFENFEFRFVFDNA